MCTNQVIQPIPEIPQQIIVSANKSKLVVFIGAGISMLHGCKSWLQLSNELIEVCYKENIINFREKETLCNNRDAKKNITIAQELLNKNEKISLFNETLINALKGKEDVGNINIYNCINKFRGLILTTNADKLLHHHYHKTKIKYQIEEFDKDNIESNCLYQIHGCIDNINSLVFTVPQYLNHYTKPKFRDFLNTIFRDYTVLFLGYGLNEFEILDFLFNTIPKQQLKGIEYKHYMLAPFYQNENHLLEIEQEYYNAFGIKLIGYLKDFKGYEQQGVVLQKWESEINQITRYITKTLQYIDDVLNHYPTPDEICNIIQIINDEATHQRYFLEKLSSCFEPLPWFMPLYEEGILEPNNNPMLFKDEYNHSKVQIVEIVEALINISKKNTYQNNDISKIILEIFNNIILTPTTNSYNDYRLISLMATFPLDYYEDRHYQYIYKTLTDAVDISLISKAINEELLPRLLIERSISNILSLLKIILSYRSINKYGECISLLGEYELFDLLNKNKTLIAAICGYPAFEVGISKIKEILNKDRTSFTSISIPTIENDDQTPTFSYVCQLVHFVRDMMNSFTDEEKIKVSKDLMKAKKPIFRRLGYYLINKNYDDLSSIFWREDVNPLISLDHFHEVYMLLEINAQRISEFEIEIFLRWLNQIDETFIENENRDEVIAFYKKRWLHSLAKTNNIKIKENFQKYQEIDASPIEYPEYLSWSSGLINIPALSPFTPEMIDRMSNEEVVHYLENFDETEYRKKNVRKEEYHINIESAFKDEIIRNFEKFTSDMMPFLNLSPIYLHALLWGIEDKMNKENRNIFKNILIFIEQVIKNNNTWDFEDEESEIVYYQREIISSIARIIDKGVDIYLTADNTKIVPYIENIIAILLRRLKNTNNYLKNNVLDNVASPEGWITFAALNYSIRYFHLYKEKSKEWNGKIRNIFTDYVNNYIDLRVDISFFVILGYFLNPIYSLDKNWLNNHFSKIFDKENICIWEASFSGYLKMNSEIHENIYYLFKKNNDFINGLKYSFRDETVKSKLIQIIVLGYFSGWETLEEEGSLIKTMLSLDDYLIIVEAIRFIASYSNRSEINYEDYILSIWSVLIKEKYYEKDYGNVLSNALIKLLGNITICEKTFEWIKLLINKDTSVSGITELIKHIKKHVKNSPHLIGDILLFILKKDAELGYNEENVIDIIKTLYLANDSELKDKANRICNCMTMKGLTYQKEIFNLNNPD